MMDRLPTTFARFEMMEYHRPTMSDGDSSGRILVIEDQRTVADVIRRSLVACGYRVDVSHDGEQGLKLAMSGEYGLVVVDLLLPHMDGLSLCRCLRANGFAMPVLMLTGLGATMEIEDARLHGADDLMVKPFDVEMLQQRVRTLIEERVPARPDVRLGALLFDRDNRTLAIDGALIPLSPMEFSLLEFLVRYRGRVIGYGLMGQHIWGSTRVSPLVTDILVNAIQLKSAWGIAIEHIPQVGYRLS